MNATKRWAVVTRWGPHAAAAIVLALLLVWDQRVFDGIRGFRSPFLTWLTDRVSQLRGATFPSAVALLMIAVGVMRRRSTLWRAGIAVIVTVLLVGVLTTVMKEVIGRPGPVDARLHARSLFDERFGRFPSSHSAVTIGAATAIAAFFPAAAVPAFLVALLVCHERIYRGTHFPSDIFAGMWIGLVCAQFVLVQLSRREGFRDAIERARVRRRRRQPAIATWAEGKSERGDGETVA